MEKQEVARLYDAYSRDVYRLALSYLRSTQDAEDICQSVFLKLLETNTTLLFQKEKAWLLKCTANACKPGHDRLYYVHSIPPNKYLLLLYFVFPDNQGII